MGLHARAHLSQRRFPQVPLWHGARSRRALALLSFLGLVCVVCSFVEPFERFGLGTLPLAALAFVLAFFSVRLSQRQGGSVLLSFAAIAASFPLVFFGLTPYAFMFLMPVGKA